jgi:hypothetical protein
MKSAMASPFVPISFQLPNHRAAQGVIYADMISHYLDVGEMKIIMSKSSVQGAAAKEAAKQEDFNQYDNLYIYHGNDRKEGATDINFFGGTKGFPHAYNIRNISRFKGQVYSLEYDMPDYASMLEYKLNAMKAKEGNLDSVVPEFREVDLDNLREMQKNAITIKPQHPTWDRMVIGDSHAISMYRPGYNVNSVQFKTLYGALEMGLESFINRDNVKHIECYFGNIDIRHHLCRQDDTKQAIRTLVDRYVEAVDSLDMESKVICELLPIENERRNLPKSGMYKGTKFFGSWAERNDARLYFKEYAMSKVQGTDVQFKEWITPHFYNGIGELDFKAMESPKSVHLSREFYPHWQGKEYNDIEENTIEDFFS